MSPRASERASLVARGERSLRVARTFVGISGYDYPRWRGAFYPERLAKSGVLALGTKTGPFLWQLPASYQFEPERLDRFMRMLPRSSAEAESVARQHDHRLRRGALVDAEGGRRVKYRHAFEVRHPSYFCDEFYDILRAHKCALVFADTAGRFGYADVVTSDFVYIRLHGSTELYVSGYSDDELDDWAGRVRRWQSARSRDAYIYFDNDAKVHAPHDALRLAERLEVRLDSK
jgi:uncharacterized protein YecE (DUF72 family)